MHIKIIILAIIKDLNPRMCILFRTFSFIPILYPNNISIKHNERFWNVSVWFLKILGRSPYLIKRYPRTITPPFIIRANIFFTFYIIS